MNLNPEIIEVSSDSSFDSTELTNVQPPQKFKPILGCKTKEQARKKKNDVNASTKPPTPSSSDEDLSHLPCYVYDSEDNDDINRQEKVFQRELEKATSSFR